MMSRARRAPATPAPLPGALGRSTSIDGYHQPPTADGDHMVLIVNPLQSTLAHYERELLDVLEHSDTYAVSVADTVAGDGITGPLKRALVTLQTIRDRLRLAKTARGQTIIVIWPLFGYLEPLALRSIARHNIVYLIVHDPSPLQRSYGQSRFARKLFERTVRHQRIRIIYHTSHAQEVGKRETGIEGTVIPHPVGTVMRHAVAVHPGHAERPVVRVLGRFKDTRSLAALESIATELAGAVRLEIHGRGWPSIPGWSVNDHFVPEDEFGSLIESSSCVVIPYDYFFQSGVAVRCLEAGIPIAAPSHEHITQLYGGDWTGLVSDDADWHMAVRRALDIPTAEVRSRHAQVAKDIQDAWAKLLAANATANFN